MLNLKSELDKVINFVMNSGDPPHPSRRKIKKEQAVSLQCYNVKVKKVGQKTHNIVLHGISHCNNPKEKAVQFFAQGMQIQTTPTYAFFLGNSTNQRTPLLVKFATYQEKQEIMRNLHKLKYSSFNVQVEDELSPSIRLQRSKWKKQLYHEKQQGNKVFFKGGQLFVIGKPAQKSTQSNATSFVISSSITTEAPNSDPSPAVNTPAPSTSPSIPPSSPFLRKKRAAPSPPAMHDDLSLQLNNSYPSLQLNVNAPHVPLRRHKSFISKT